MKADLPQCGVLGKNPRPPHRPSPAGGMGDLHPIPCLVYPSPPTRPGSTHTSLAGSARPSTTRIFRELLLAMAPSPKLSGQEGAQVPRLDRGEEGGRLHITNCELGALSRSPSAACPRRGGAGREISEGGEMTGVRGGGAS